MEEFWTGHRERLRLRMAEAGSDSLKTQELIELILFYALPRVDMADTARALVNELGTIERIFHAPPEVLLAVPGVTKPVADWIMLTGELLDAYCAIDRENQPRVWRFRDVMRFLVPRWRAVPPPQTWIMYTDYDNRLMTYSAICESLSWQDPVYAREIVSEAIEMQAKHAIILMFMGTAPLELDKAELDYLVAFSRTMRAIDVELLDCVLVGEAGFVSLNTEGAMARIRRESEQPGLHERYAGGEGEGGGEVLMEGWELETGMEE